MHLVISADFSDWLYLAVKSGKRLTAREIRGKKKHKILWCMRESEGVFCGGQCPFFFGLYLGKERSDGIAIAARSADRVQCGVRSVISAAPKARKARGVHVPKQGKKKAPLIRCFLAPVEGLEPPTLRLTAACSTG